MGRRRPKTLGKCTSVLVHMYTFREKDEAVLVT